MTVTLAEVVGQVMTKLSGAGRPVYNLLDGDIDDAAMAIVMRLPLHAGMVVGAVLEVDSELVYVADRDVANRTVVVIRGWLGTIATDHTDGTGVALNPRFTNHEVRTELWAEANGAFPALGRPVAAQVEVGGGERIARLPFGPGGIPGTSVGDTLSLTIANAWGANTLSGRVQQGWEHDGDDALTGEPEARLVLSRALGDTARVTATVLVPLDAGVDPAQVYDGDDMLSTWGTGRLGISAVVMGTVYRLMATRVVQRTDIAHQSESRLATEVSVGDMAGAIERLRATRDRLRAEAMGALRAAYPWRLQ